ncbi:MAG: 16S rRNA (adenine(1518)-N(6)/adenine(1519)-N(6))-dimethyltransferase RsmA [Alphaproteobacteria bacterium]|jgi:16S rRNA (adenine1518-N6/adenine1519-N6)-dimethyltransferase|nr:16S rRNA (adenine(1518)-N(6)/adenine(1519)-N(6))-dimethyltransferase RsmA [Alphaproteobacteria bacterium]
MRADDAPAGPPPSQAGLAGLPPLRAVIAEYGLAARKSLGQHFLLDLNLTARIARAAGDLSGLSVIEIGPGPGGLTRALLATPAACIVAVERDRRCLAALADLQERAGGRLRLVAGDALALDDRTLAPAPRAVVANLPYNIATVLLLRWLQRIADYESLTLMVQREVAERLTASPGSKAYGRLSVITQWRSRAEPVLRLPARAFTPPPKVDSTVVRLVPRPDPETAAWPAMERVTAAAFGKRRKMLRQSLKPLGDAEALLAATGIAPTWRAEDLDIAAFAALARAVDRQGA